MSERVMDESPPVQRTSRPDGSHDRIEIRLGGTIYVIPIKDAEELARTILSLLEIDVNKRLEIRGTFQNQPTRHMLRLIADDLEPAGSFTYPDVKRARANWLRDFARALGGDK